MHQTMNEQGRDVPFVIQSRCGAPLIVATTVMFRISHTYHSQSL